MAQVFISYSQPEAEPTAALARELEAAGFTVWWDTSLLPDDLHFPDTIRREITGAQAAVVIWTPSSVKSRWVYGEAKLADEQGKLIQLRTPALDPGSIPLPFNTGQISLVTDHGALLRALERKGLTVQLSEQKNISQVMFTPAALVGTEWKIMAAFQCFCRFAEGSQMELYIRGPTGARVMPVSGTWMLTKNYISIHVPGNIFSGQMTSATTMSGTYIWSGATRTWRATLCC
jgi:hypothetical protein